MTRDQRVAAAGDRAAAFLTDARGNVNPLVVLLGVGLLLRLLFVGSLGFHNDVQAFEAWAITLRDNPPWQFYPKAGFADYPPGYLLVLWVLAKIYAVVPGAHDDPANGYLLIRILVKLPAIAMDLVNAAVVFALARRFASRTVALVAAGFVALNPAAIYVSAYWGQIDSISWGLVLIALWALVTAGDGGANSTRRITLAWLAFAFSLLIKPQAATVGAMLLAFPFATADAAVRRRRLTGTAAGIGAAVVLALAVALVFHPAADVVQWLVGRYVFGSNVYAYNSVNAFSLYAVRQPFWQPDATPLTLFGVALGPLSAWGVVLVAAATLLVAGRYLQLRSDAALLEGAMLCAFAFFILATRMHERYVYGAFLLAAPLVALGRRRLWASVILSLTMYLNLAYSLAYQTVMEAKPPGVDPTDLWPAITHPAALANVLLLFWLTFAYLGEARAAAKPAEGADALGPMRGAIDAVTARARSWFDPREGIVAMTRLDWLLASSFTLFSFVLCVVRLDFPAEKYFDEIYYARAGEEYIKHLDVSGWGPFEFTHPPLSKLLITLSMLLFGGLHGLGDTGVGWRFMNVVVGALTVLVIYCFAKRLTGHTLFASLAAGMLAVDGFHYAQSRIATPEISVAFFSLLTLYAFYRLWLAVQIARRQPLVPRAARGLLATMLGGVCVAAAVALFVVPAHSGPIVRGPDFVVWSQVIAFGWFVTLFWLIGRAVVVPRLAGAAREVSYAEGSRVLDAAGTPSLITAEGREVPLHAGKTALREASDDGLVRTFDRNGSLAYETPAADAAYRADGSAHVAGTTATWRDARPWWIVLALSSALLADTKWNGLFDFGVIWLVLAVVYAQRWLRRPATFGNPFGAPLDLVAAAMIVAGGIIYTASYIPYFTLGHGFVDMVAMQHDMYRYHSTLVATHPYASVWWQWPLLDRPILYYANYTHIAPRGSPDCCVSTIRALPNPLIWWSGLISVPLVAILAWQERNKGYALLALAYLLQWLPWIRSPRLAFEYHFFPNLAIIVLANAIVLQRVWNWGRERRLRWTTWAVYGYAAAVFVLFIYFFPIVSGWPITWDAWQHRMWNPHWI